MEGAARFVNAYQMTSLSRFIFGLSCCCCINKESYERKLFFGKWLKVREAIDPTLILWENLGISQKERCLRITLKGIISAILVLATTLFILYAKIYESNVNENQVICDESDVFTRE